MSEAAAKQAAEQTFLLGLEAEQRSVELSQYYTPPQLAAELWDWACQEHDAQSVLEPSAGNGSLLRPMFTASKKSWPKHVCAWEIDPGKAAQIERLWRPSGLCFDLMVGDFLRESKAAAIMQGVRFDLGLLNPPYESTKDWPIGQDVAFILRALECCDRLCGVFRAGIKFGQKRREGLWRFVQVVREVDLSERPDFGGDDNAKTDFVLLELVRRAKDRAPRQVDLVRREIW
jgi:predicted RNA methylase